MKDDNYRREKSKPKAIPEKTLKKLKNLDISCDNAKARYESRNSVPFANLNVKGPSAYDFISKKYPSSY